MKFKKGYIINDNGDNTIISFILGTTRDKQYYKEIFYYGNGIDCYQDSGQYYTHQDDEDSFLYTDIFVK